MFEINSFSQGLAQLLTAGFLALSVLLALTKAANCTWISWTFACACGLFAHRLTLTGLSFMTIFATVYRVARQSKLPHRGRCGVCGFLTLLGILFYLHLVPGFDNWCWLSLGPFSFDSQPLKTYINLDKVLAGVVFLSGLPRENRIALTSRRAFQRWLVASFLAIGSIVLTSQALGYVRLDLKWRGFMPLWLLLNLIFVVIPEEGFYRGYLLRELGDLLPRSRWTPHLAVLISGSIFGFQHAVIALIFQSRHSQASLKFGVLATLAGIGYGYAARASQSLYGAIGAHFALNALHLVAFSYPALR